MGHADAAAAAGAELLQQVLLQQLLLLSGAAALQVCMSSIGLLKMKRQQLRTVSFVVCWCLKRPHLLLCILYDGDTARAAAAAHMGWGVSSVYEFKCNEFKCMSVLVLGCIFSS